MADTTTAAPAAASSAPAGGAPSSAPADGASSSPAASAAGAGGPAQSTGAAESSSGAAVSPGSEGGSGERFIELPDRFKDPVGFHERLNALTDEEMDLFAEGKIKTIETTPAADKPAEGGDKPAAEAPKPAEGQDHGDEIVPLSKEEFEKLPPAAQKLIQTAEKRLERLSEYEADLGPLLDPKARQELDALLDDPRVRMVLDQRTRGDKFSFDHEAVLNPENLQKVIQAAGVSIEAFDGLTDPKGTMEALAAVARQAVQVGLDAGKTRAQLDAAEATAKIERQNFFDNSLKDLTTKIDSLKSNLNYNDPNHPIAPFIQHIQSLLAGRKISYEYLKEIGSLEPAFIAWQTTQKGGLAAIIKKPEANMRNRLVRDMAETVTATAVNAAGRGMPAAAPNTNTKYGIDGSRYLSDEAYRDHVLDQKASDPEVMDALGRLGATGKW